MQKLFCLLLLQTRAFHHSTSSPKPFPGSSWLLDGCSLCCSGAAQIPAQLFLMDNSCGFPLNLPPSQLVEISILYLYLKYLHLRYLYVRYRYIKYTVGSSILHFLQEYPPIRNILHFLQEYPPIPLFLYSIPKVLCCPEPWLEGHSSKGSKPMDVCTQEQREPS